MKASITSIINNEAAAEALSEKISKVAPKGTERVFIGNAIVRIAIDGFIVIEDLEGLTKLGLELEAIEANGKDQLSITFKRGSA